MHAGLLAQGQFHWPEGLASVGETDEERQGVSIGVARESRWMANTAVDGESVDVVLPRNVEAAIPIEGDALGSR